MVYVCVCVGPVGNTYQTVRTLLPEEYTSHAVTMRCRCVCVVVCVVGWGADGSSSVCRVCSKEAVWVSQRMAVLAPAAANRRARRNAIAHVAHASRGHCR